MLSWFVYATLGKILIYLWMQFHFPRWLTNEWLESLHSCDLCSGVWIYTFLAFFLKINLMQLFGFNYVFVVNEVLLGALTSYIVNIFSIGFREKFLSVTIV